MSISMRNIAMLTVYGVMHIMIKSHIIIRLASTFSVALDAERVRNAQSQ
jgi:hypothetical protein